MLTCKQNTLCFIYGTNYLAGAYGYYAASALAGNAVMRSIFGATLPLAGATMYAKLTPQWAGTLLGLMEVVLVPIPFIFYRYGDRIRAKSQVIKEMREEQAKQDKKRAKLEMKRQRQADASSSEPEAILNKETAVAEEKKETGEGRAADQVTVTAVDDGDVEKGPQ